VLIEYFDEAPTYTPPQSKFNSQNFRQKETSQDAPQTAALSPQPAAAAHVHDADINQNPEPPYPQFDKSSKALGDPRDYTRQKAFTGSGAGELVPQHWLNPSLPLVQDTAEERVQRSLNMAAKQVRCFSHAPISLCIHLDLEFSEQDVFEYSITQSETGNRAGVV
jgi:hypothetical protein